MPPKTDNPHNFIEISNLDLPELDAYKQRNEVRLLRINEPAPGIFICESAKVIRRAIEAGYEPISILTAVNNPDEDTRYVYDACKDVPIYYGTDEILRELSGYALTGGVFSAMRRKPLDSIKEIVSGKKLIAVLENVQNPTNVGAIFRSAAAMGVEAIILTYDCSDPLYRRAERVSMGTVFQIPWTKIDKKTDYIEELSDNGFTTVAMALRDDAVRIDNPGIKECDKLAIILGNEGYGLCSDTIKRSDYVSMIPMNPAVDSLNVGAASAVMFWELMRDRL
ncbi:MAG: RNA methyltransferase [Lachnospiraceae bacterium]|jgi:tRNA G18 (ribose-2'-O)-methylase SpoU|nr:RNA methyltransferase [Lachnospiraceae bacterium]